ncbi:uncharacterized protein LOC127860029 isoform X33 [Dreissena polymorpha]|uniref:uncharacterized protein LOC127860029 isoform X33 n=1 Tax=Dreissena polymorpha TaxID=45954 RepID=UPI002264B4B1|nr:uncharacterized protein LOC127860029 isoform X33 [Dreissena polymorpha]
MAGLSMAGKVVMEPRSAFCQVMVVMFLRVVTSHAQGVLYNETCVEGLHDSCVTTNAVCRNTGEGLKCMCSEEEIYVKPNDTCVEKLDVDFTNIDVNISSVNSTSCFVTITTTTNGTLYDEYIVELQSPVSLEKRTFSTNQFRLHELLSGTKYNMSLWVAKAGISSKSSKSFQEVVATIPSTPVNVRIPKELVYEKNFTLLLSVPDQRFHYVFVQANSANTVKRYFFIRDSTIGNISVVIDGLLAATYYTVLTQTVDKNNVSYSAISDIITSNTAPVLPFVSTRVRCIYFKRLITEFSFSLVNVNYIAYLNNTIVEFDRYGNWMVYRIPHDGSCEAVYVFKIFSTLGNISSEGYALETMHLCPSLPSLSISNRTTNSFQLNVLAACQVSKMTASGYCLGYDYNRTRDNAVYEITSNEISDRMFKFVHSQSQQGAYCHFSVTLFKTVSSYIITGHTGSIETTLLRGVPDPMYDLSLRIVAATHAWIWWKNPVMRNGQIWGITGNVISDEDNTCVIEYSQNIMRCRYQQSLILYHIISYDINQSLNITNLQPYKNYSFTIRYVGMSSQVSRDATLKFQTLESIPSFVQNISMSFIGAQNATVKWVEPSNINGLLTCFYIELVNDSSLYRNTDNWNITLKIQPNARVMLLRDLLPYTNYSVRVSAQNVAWNGSYNQTVEFRTHIGVPDTPTGITIGQVLSSMIEVKWNISGYYSGPTRFAINGEDAFNGSIMYTNITRIGWSTDELENQSMLTGLAPFWNYSVTVRAETVDGQLKHISEQSSPIIVQTKEDVPGFVQNISMSYIGAQNASIKWVEPRNINGLLTCFYIELVNVSSLYRKTDNWNNTLKIQPNAREMLLHFLLPYTNYSVQVKAQNVAMNGSYNEVVKFRTRIGVSDIPTGITIRRVSSSMIEVKWNNSGYYSGPTRFVITATDSINRSITFTNVTSIGWWTDEMEHQSMLTGLNSLWNYSVTVRAETVDGDLQLLSNPSPPIIVFTEEDETEINSESPKQNGHCDFWTNTQVVEPYALCASFITKMADVAPEMSCEGKEFHYSLKEAARIVNMLNLQVVNTTTLQQQMTGPLMEEPVEKKNTQLQMDVIQKLSKIKSQHACSVMALIYSLNTVIRRKENITPEIQKKALEIYKSLLDSYKNTSADVPTHIVEHIAQTLVTGTVMMMDFTEHESDKTVLKESAAVLINIIDNVMDILQNNKETNAPASDIVTSEAYIKVAKLSPDKINGNTLNEVMKSGLHFPPNMNLTQDSGGSITMQYLYIQKNPYNWGESSDLVTTPVQSISFKDEQNKKINVSNLTEPVRITIPITRKSLTNQMKNIPIRLNILKRNTSWTLYPKMSHSCVGTFHVSLQKNMLLSMIFTLPGKVKSINLGIGKNRIVDKSSVFDKPFKYPSDIPIIDNLYGLHSDEDMTAEFENTTMFGDAFEFKNCAFFCSIYLGRCCSANVSECWEIYDYCNERGLVNVSHHCLAVLQETHMIKTMNKTQTNQNSIKQILLTMYNSDEKLNKTGSYLHIGVGLDIDIAEVREIISERNKECLGNQTAILCFAEVEVNISVSVNSLGCLYWDEEIEDWTSNGLQVGQLVSLSNANDTSYECITTHLSSFSGSVQMASIFIDPFGDAVLFITFFENPVLVTTVILVWVLYFFLLYWARNSDKKDLERVGVVNCKDNLQSEEYLYLVCIVTGWWKQAGTTANVYINMTGSEGVSGRKCLTHAGRQCFQAGYEDWFLITTTKCLGNIKSVTLWHDGTGDSPQWYLNHVNVRDVQTRNSWTFIYNDWLAVDGDAFWQISATIKAVTEEETRLKTKYNFMIQSSRGIRDGHLWLSIFTKAPMSTFTRVQRLTCALSLLLTTMLTNLIFYGVPTDDPAQQVQDGAFRLSFSQIVIGIESSLIMFPVNLIIILLFIKVKPKSRKSAIKPSFGSADIHAMTDSCVVNITRIFNHSTMHNPASVLTAVKQSHNHSNLRLFHDKFCELKGLKFCLDPNLSVTKFVKNVGTLYLPLATETTIMEKNVDDAGSFSMSENKGSGTEDAESSVSFGALPSSFPSRDSSVCQHKGRTQSAKQHKDTFSFSSEVASDQDKMRSDAHIRTVIDVPVGIRNDSRILSWWFIYIAWFVAIGTCFVSSYFVVLYGLKFGYAHSAALLVSFLTGLVQSIFVLLPIKVLCTAVLLTLIFKTPAEFDDIDGPRAMDDDQEYLKNVTEEPAFHHNLRTQLPARLLKSIRRRLRLDWIMDVNIRNIIIHFAYMSIVILMSTCQINISNSYATSLSVRNMFVNNKFGVPLKNQVSSREGMFSYLHKTVSPLMMTMSETGERNLSITTEFFLVGGYRLRQARISKDKCRPPISMENIPSGCQPAYSTFMEDRNRYNMSWDNLIDAAYNSTWINLTANRKDPWSYQPALSLRTMPFVGLFDTYSGGGYVQEMAALEDPTDNISELEEAGWIDDNTRAVFLEFTLYNANVDIFTVAV